MFIVCLGWSEMSGCSRQFQNAELLLHVDQHHSSPGHVCSWEHPVSTRAQPQPRDHDVAVRSRWNIQVTTWHLPSNIFEALEVQMLVHMSVCNVTLTWTTADCS